MKNVRTCKKMKKDRRKIVMVTAYEYPSAKYVQNAKVDIILVGDSLDMVIMRFSQYLCNNANTNLKHTDQDSLVKIL